jgi:hypothetical protein
VGNLREKVNMALFASFGTATESAQDDEHRKQEAPDFSLVLGGPLYQLLRKAHLEGDAMELLHRRVLAAILLTWVPLLLQDISRLALATAVPLSPLLLTILSFEELVLRAIKVLF